MEGIDFDQVDEASWNGKLMALLRTIPKERWFDKDLRELSDETLEWTLLHYACQGENGDAVAALIAHGLDIEALSSDEETPIQVSARNCTCGPLEMLIYTGADARTRDSNGYDLWDDILNAWDTWQDNKSADDCARILLMNRVKPDFGQRKRHGYLDELVTLERGIDRCRMATIAFLCVKRAGGLWRWDKFLLAHIARHVWATRSEEWDLKHKNQ